MPSDSSTRGLRYLHQLPRRLAAEFVGTAMLLAVVVGSGIMAQRLTDNVALVLFVNAMATGAGLVAIILTFGSVSADFNPAVSLADAMSGKRTVRELLLYTGVQSIGAFIGVLITHIMFDLPIVTHSMHERSSRHLWLSEAVATFGLVMVVRGTSKSAPRYVPFAVAGYITAAYWFTSSTSFANPAVTLARTFTDTFVGIAPGSVAGFVLAQVVGATAAWLLSRWLFANSKDVI
jgi:glycerol uptake facilitator-like aquaporin